MYPVTHITIAVGAVRGGERLVRALTGRTAATATAIDYRFAALGSQVPDLIDKPLKWFLFPGLPDDHVYGHTLLLPLCIVLAGLVLLRLGDSRLLVLGLGCLTHPLVDPTNTYPGTLFWPAFGTEFPEATQAYRNLYQKPLDVILLLTYGYFIWRSERWRLAAWAFVRHGTFPGDEEAEGGNQGRAKSG